jgi:glutaredoxin
MKILKMLALPVVLAICFAVGLYGAPLARATYAKLFPTPPYVSGDYQSIYASAGNTVVLFSTSTCPYCKKTRDLLHEKGVAYTDYVIDKSKDAESRFIKNGGAAVPMLFIGNRKILGFNALTITSAISVLPKSKEMGKTQPASG